jgi:hypothetical protein
VIPPSSGVQEFSRAGIVDITMSRIRNQKQKAAAEYRGGFE